MSHESLNRRIYPTPKLIVAIYLSDWRDNSESFLIRSGACRSKGKFIRLNESLFSKFILEPLVIAGAAGHSVDWSIVLWIE